MCGIAISITYEPLDCEVVERTLKTMWNRGPDSNGHYHSTLGQFNVSLIHTRLSIIDIDKRADQPLASSNCVLIYHGEFYYSLELRAELISWGHQFSTNSDTEVIIKSYRQWGADCLTHFEGMWAFALLDLELQQLFISRDRFGEKPLFWTTTSRGLYLASEIKALAAISETSFSPNLQQVKRYLVNGYRSLHKQPSTFFENVHAIPSASYVMLTKPQMSKTEKYWKLTFDPQSMSLIDAIDGVREKLRQSVKLRLRADVPLALCLSGGVDSTLLTAIAAKEFNKEIHTFSLVDKDPRYDESDNIDSTTGFLNTKNHKLEIGSDGFLDDLQRLVSYHDSPVSTISYFIHSLLIKSVRAHGYKVILSGNGADEIFTGYYDHYGFWLAENRHSPDYQRFLSEWHEGYGQTVRNPILRDPETFSKNLKERSHIYLDRNTFNSLLVEPITEDFFEETYTSSLLRNRMINELLHETVPVVLHEEDLNSMLFSIENRSPYLDKPLTEFAYQIPTAHLIKNGFLKWILRSAGMDIAPPNVLFDKRKRGFNASIDTLLDRSDKSTKDRLLEPSPIFDIVQRDAMKKYVTENMTPNSMSKFLFSFISAKFFLESCQN